MPPIRIDRKQCGLRIRVLLPIFIFGIVVAGSLVVSNMSLVDQQFWRLVDQRSSAVIKGLEFLMEERKDTYQAMARLLAEEPGLASKVAEGDVANLTGLLAQLQSWLGIDAIDVYKGNSRELFQLGSIGTVAEREFLITNFRRGLTQSVAVSNLEGMELSASAPIRESGGVTGVLLLGHVVGESELRRLDAQDWVELAVYHHDTPVLTTTQGQEWEDFLQKGRPASGPLHSVNQNGTSYRFQAVTLPLDNAGVLVALVGVEDLARAMELRNLLLLVLGVATVGVLVLFSRMVDCQIADPLRNMAGIASEMVKGNFGLQVPKSSIRELDRLGSALNCMAQKV